MIKKLLFGIVGIAALVVGGGALWLTGLPASNPAPDITVDRSPDRVARGEYLVEHVTPCFACHARRDPDRYGMPAVTRAVGECWDEQVGFPALVCAPNLTPDAEVGLGGWTDGEILRAVREGISRDGHGLFPIMPYGEFAALSDDDAMAVIAYLRTLEPIAAEPVGRDIPFPMSLATRFAPQPVEGPVTAPDRSDTVAYGQYLARIAGCRFCHTPIDETEQMIEGQLFAGGHEMILPGGARVYSSNLTPHETGLAGTAKENFIGLFRAFADIDAVAVEAPPGMNTFMPWYGYAGMTDEDLGAIYDYLRSLTPIENVVDNWPDRPAGN